MYVMKRTTIELDEALLERAKRALGKSTARATVEEALRRAAASGEADRDEAAARLRRYVRDLGAKADLEVLLSEDMWK